MLADQCLEMLENDQPKAGNGSSQLFSARAKALKGLVELVNGNVQSGKVIGLQTYSIDFDGFGLCWYSMRSYLYSAGSFFQGLEDCGGCTGEVPFVNR